MAVDVKKEVSFRWLSDDLALSLAFVVDCRHQPAQVIVLTGTTNNTAEMNTLLLHVYEG